MCPLEAPESPSLLSFPRRVPQLSGLTGVCSPVVGAKLPDHPGWSGQPAANQEPGAGEQTHGEKASSMTLLGCKQVD